MATRVSAVGAAGNFQDGSAWVGGVAPTAADDAVLQATTTSMTIGSGSVCRSLTATAFTGTLTHTAGVTLTIGDGTAGAGNVALAFGTFTYTLGNASTSAISFISTSATTQTVNFNGKTTGNVTFNASSNGSWQYTGGHVTGSAATVTLTKGTLDINGQTCSWGLFSSNSTDTRTLILGSSSITISGTGTSVWNAATTTGQTSWSCASSTITFSGAVATFAGRNAYGAMVWSNATTAQHNGLGVTNTSISVTGGSLKTAAFKVAGSLSISGAITLAGNSSINRLFVWSNVTGTASTITAATVSVSNSDFQDITGAGMADWDFNARTDIGDCGGNSNIIFPASVSQTWNGASGGNWSTNAWTTRVPLPQDDVSLGVAFSASQTVTADMPRLGRSISFSGATGSPTWALANDCFIYGNLVQISGMSATGNFVISMGGRSAYTLTSSGVSSAHSYTLNAPTGSMTLNDALTCKGFRIDNGTFNTSNFTITLNQPFSFFTSNTGTRTINLGTSNIIFSSNTLQSNFWNFVGSPTLAASSSTILLTGTSTATKTFIGAGLTYGTLTYTVAGSTGELDITGSNSFAQINFSDASNARSLKFTAGTTQTIRNSNGFNVRGTSGKLMTIDTITGASTFTLTSSNQQATDYMNVVRSTVNASPVWYAGANSTNGGTNTNWVFEAAPVLSGSNTDLSAQSILNIMYGSTPSQYTLQEIANLHNGTSKTSLSFQQVLNIRQGNQSTLKTEQECLYDNLATELGLTGQNTDYSVQELLNLAYKNNLGISDVLL
jgi:hypothetical protein